MASLNPVAMYSSPPTFAVGDALTEGVALVVVTCTSTNARSISVGLVHSQAIWLIPAVSVTPVGALGAVVSPFSAWLIRLVPLL